MTKLIAAAQYNPLGEPLRGIGPLGLENVPANVLKDTAAGVFVDAVSKIIGFLTAAAIIWFIFQFILGAIGWISAGGDTKAVEAAKGKLTNAIAGIVIVIVTMVIMSAIGALLGIDIFNLGGFICTLTPGGC